MLDQKIAKFARSLLKKRIASDPKAAAFGQDESFADSLSETMLAGLPETTILTCCKSIKVLYAERHSPVQIIRLLASYRGWSVRDGESMKDFVIRNTMNESGNRASISLEHLSYCFDFGIEHV